MCATALTRHHIEADLRTEVHRGVGARSEREESDGE